MKAIQLKRSFLFRFILLKQWPHYKEVETNILIGIYLMNCDLERCSCNTLSAYLSKIHRTPHKKTLLATLRKFKEGEFIRVNGRGPGTSIHLTIAAELYLFELEAKLKRYRN